MRGGATVVNETQKWATSKKRLRTTDVTNGANLYSKLLTAHNTTDITVVLCPGKDATYTALPTKNQDSYGRT
jgi:hypothetical protein